MKTMQSLLVAATALALASCAAQMTGAPDLPQAIAAPAGEKPILKTAAVGVQLYECATGKSGAPEWTFRGPEAELYDMGGRHVGSHGAGPSWQHADGSKVVAGVAGSAEAADASSIPLLLLKVKAASGDGRFAQVKSVQRLDTHGGKAPKAACKAGDWYRAPYSATYVFLG